MTEDFTPVPSWHSWSRITVALEGEPGITLEELYSAFIHRFEASQRNVLRGQEAEIAERLYP